MMTKTADRIGYWLLKDVNKAIRDFQMIGDGDRVAVALSGGKDSLALLQLLEMRRKYVSDRYNVIAIHVLGDANGPSDQIHPPLMVWLQDNQIPAHFVKLQLPVGEELPLACQRCAFNRRKTLLKTANALGCNVIAFGHHADDLAQTTLMNLIDHGVVETMPPRREYFHGKIRIIRPLCYLPEKDIRRYARSCQFPTPPPPCPLGDKTQRRFAADLILQAEKNCRQARINLLRAGLKYMDI